MWTVERRNTSSAREGYVLCRWVIARVRRWTGTLSPGRKVYTRRAGCALWDREVKSSSKDALVKLPLQCCPPKSIAHDCSSAFLGADRHPCSNLDPVLARRSPGLSNMQLAAAIGQRVRGSAVSWQMPANVYGWVAGTVRYSDLAALSCTYAARPTLGLRLRPSTLVYFQISLERSYATGQKQIPSSPAPVGGFTQTERPDWN